MNILSFTLSGSFAAFRDPTVTTNQTVYFIPSKSTIIGLLGAILGTKRGHNLGEIYGKEYMELFKKTNIGIQLCNYPKKIILYTNHVSMKKSITKPVKSELLESPQYVIYVQTSDEINEDLTERIRKNKFVFSPYLGHAYCPAKINFLNHNQAEKIDPINMKTNCVILDESDMGENNASIRVGDSGENPKIIIERHLHHFFDEDKFVRRVLKHWIPVNNSEYLIINDHERKLSKFVEIDGRAICIY